MNTKRKRPLMDWLINLRTERFFAPNQLQFHECKCSCKLFTNKLDRMEIDKPGGMSLDFTANV